MLHLHLLGSALIGGTVRDTSALLQVTSKKDKSRLSAAHSSFDEEENSIPKRRRF